MQEPKCQLTTQWGQYHSIKFYTNSLIKGKMCNSVCSSAYKSCQNSKMLSTLSSEMTEKTEK
jgi:hypothetical protein